ncbi:AMP-binding protein, partial [Nocardia sp. CNY236]|uniref:AMP-binding protein n=1 Tax=Nocardia sp. CNY236 TaxID=1169152 RepID=UPI000563D851
YTETGAPAGITGILTYASALFDEGTITGVSHRFSRLLDEVVAAKDSAVGDLDVLAAAEWTELVSQRNATDQPVDVSATLVSLLEAAVSAEPAAVALVADGDTGRQELTYAQLDARVNRLARYLIGRGIGPEDRVVLAMRRSVDLVVAMYAVTKTGAAYVPIDPEQPAERTSYIVTTAAPVCVLTTANDDFSTTMADIVRVDTLDLTEYTDAPVTDADRHAPLRCHNTAYVIFTSGSTGQPKGVAVTHAAIANQLVWKRAEFGMDTADAVLLKTAATFDLSVWEFWSALACGGRLVIAKPDGHRDPEYLSTLIAQEWVTTMHVVPSMLEALLTVGLPDSVWR